MIVVTQENDKYEIRFRYDPNVIDIVKQVPGRIWDPEKKCWSIPAARLGMLIAQFKGTPYEQCVKIESEENININETLDSTTVPDIDVSDHVFRVADGCEIYQHQVDSVKFDKYRNLHGLHSGFLLADEPGAGKTLSVMNIAYYHKEHFNCKHCLIICCVNSAKYNWLDDIIKHTNGQEEPYLLGTRKRRNGNISLVGTGKQKLEDLMSMHMYSDMTAPELPYFIVMNIEALHVKMGKTYILANRIIEMINSGEIGMIAIDEIHKGCSMHSVQGKQLLRIKKECKVDIEWIPMTGTPIASKPTDVFLPMRLVDGHKSNSFSAWCGTFCLYGGFDGRDIVGYRNIDQLKNILQPNMLRRLKSQILDLPPKIHYTEYVENTSYQARLYHQIRDEIRDSKERIVYGMNPLSSFLRLRQVNGSPELVDLSLSVDSQDYLSKNAKLARALELIDEITSSGEKVVVFSNWVEPLRTLYKYVSRTHKTCCYTGTMSQEDREKHKKAFISNPEYKVILGTVGALGTSHTLTVAKNVIFYDSPWNPSDIVQCEDRCHRAGTTEPVSIYTLVTLDTVDEVVHKILSRKEGTAKYIVDNDMDIRNHPELFDLLVGD